MYVCAKCNSLVEQPARRWWSRWRYCPNGHVLYVRGLGPSLEQSFRKSFLRGLAPGIGVFGLIVLVATTQIAPEFQAASGRHVDGGMVACSLGCVVAIFYLFRGLSLLIRAHAWARRAGPVQRLVAHARGRACGVLVAVSCQLGVMMALLFAR